MRAAIRIALAALLVLASASEVTAQSRQRDRAAQRGGTPQAQFQQRNPTTSPAVKPFTAEEAGLVRPRASRNY